LQSQIGTRRLATIALFAAIYAILSLIPVSRLVGSVSFLTLAEVFSPLAGMVLGPFEGGLAVFVGTFVGFALGHPVAFDGLDFIPGVIAAVTGGLAMRGHVKATAALSLAMYIVFTLDPLSSSVIYVGSVPVPFLWMHMLSLVVFVSLSFIQKSGLSFASQTVMLASMVFLSTMNAHVAGAIMYENVLVRINDAMTQSTIRGLWGIVFYAYPVERIFFTVVGSILVVGFFRAAPPATLRRLRRR
jgi:ECF-type riboflavin transporter S component